MHPELVTILYPTSITFLPPLFVPAYQYPPSHYIVTHPSLSTALYHPPYLPTASAVLLLPQIAFVDPSAVAENFDPLVLLYSALLPIASVPQFVLAPGDTRFLLLPATMAQNHYLAFLALLPVPHRLPFPILLVLSNYPMHQKAFLVQKSFEVAPLAAVLVLVLAAAAAAAACPPVAPVWVYHLVPYPVPHRLPSPILLVLSNHPMHQKAFLVQKAVEAAPLVAVLALAAAAACPPVAPVWVYHLVPYPVLHRLPSPILLELSNHPMHQKSFLVQTAVEADPLAAVLAAAAACPPVAPVLVYSLVPYPLRHHHHHHPLLTNFRPIHLQPNQWKEEPIQRASFVLEMLTVR